MYQIGIDFSITSPGIFIFSKTGKNIFYSYTNNIKTRYDFSVENYHFILEPQINKNSFHDNFQRYISISSVVFDFLYPLLNEIEYIAIEDYALHGKGRIADIVECTTLLKKKIYDMKIPLKLYAPKTIKKNIGGNGNLSKEKIFEEKWNNEELKNIFYEFEKHVPSRKTSIKLEGDLLDAWAVWKMSTLFQ